MGGGAGAGQAAEVVLRLAGLHAAAGCLGGSTTPTNEVIALNLHQPKTNKLALAGEISLLPLSSVKDPLPKLLSLGAGGLSKKREASDEVDTKPLSSRSGP